MNKTKMDSKVLDSILMKMLKTVDGSKDEVFQIGEQSRQQYEQLVEELKQIKQQVYEVIELGDKLEVQTRHARNRLSEVSRNFHRFSEEEIRNAYEKAHKLQVELTMIQQREKQLRERRDDLERRLLGLQEIIERSESLVSQITVVLNYLNQDLREVGLLLADAQAKQDFGLRIIEAQEEERKRVSREIHDGPAQMLANVMMRSELIERIFRDRGAEDGFQEIKNLRQNVRNALYEVRRIIYDLRPMALDDLGLIPTLRKYLYTTEEYNGKVKIHFQCIGETEDQRLAPQFEVALFRLAQEAVSNALKHSESEEITVKVEITKDFVILMIKDNGKGFDLKEAKEKKNKSFGLLGMKERVDLLEGTMTIDSKIGLGTFIMIKVPLSL
ncbi:two-component sensor histidine kinase DegS [Bacillus subtilis]|jgi:two-component system sensor histidine kinase DegS|uniref:Signal transduction histidine-protein kinase/phosphatase DegS n=6 Tax=Bacillus TaxID=1386 RepID=DEGS_BACSU|nr:MULTISPECIES: two-component sensor histidine kinase DegS [Bacillales]NP_391430.1 two-component sensor histidine kinase [DegU] [Bacillus subtilis subsp. subtilis str. 168]P13799.2 RecName: Full=Signal transduction histidine-protein kinase/phosphatase DegS [Bacillus subtilis subsp. subtilis str. 168]AOL31283.1 histidine kinase [Alkalicoccobacillus gibsonii]AXC54557.1 signal transduction histidine kinase [Bacillus spizizenii]MBW4825262.1 two-component sensor histidine kinase DegS [Bacillaceae 